MCVDPETRTEALQLPSLVRRTRRSSLETLLPAALIVLAGILAYHRALAYPFNFDDFHAIVENPHLRQLRPISQALSAPPQSTIAGRPAVALSLAINYAFGGLNPWAYRAFNLATLLVSGLLLFGCVRRTFHTPRLRAHYEHVSTLLALLVALIWVTHPLQTECVTYIIQRTELLAGLFCWLTLYCAIRGLGSPHPGRWYAAAVVACAVGMACKEVMATVPVLVLLYDRAFTSPSFGESLRKRWGLYSALAGTWLLLLYLNASGPRSETVGFSRGVSAFTYAKNQCLALVTYCRLSVWPSSLLFDYGFPRNLSLTDVLPRGLAVAAALMLTALALIRRPMIGFLGAWFFIILAPTSSFVPITSEVAAERRMHLPLAAIIVLAVLAVYRLRDVLGRRAAWSRRWAGGFMLLLAAAAIAGLTARTIRRNEDYRSAEIMWGDVIAKRPNDYRPYNNLALALRSAGRIEEAVVYLREGVRLKPDYDIGRGNLAVALAETGQPAEALAQADELIRQEPRAAKAYFVRGTVLDIAGRLDEAVENYRRSLELEPSNADAHCDLGLVLERLGRSAEAIESLEAAIRFNPEHAEALDRLATIYLDAGQPAEAVDYLRRLTRSRPTDTEAVRKLAAALTSCGRLDEAAAAYGSLAQLAASDPNTEYDFANLLLRLGRTAEAESHYVQALKLAPNFAAARNDLAAMLLNLGRAPEAVGQFQQVLQQRPDWAEARQNLGLALAKSGRLEEAVAAYRQTLESKPDYDEAHYNLANTLLRLGRSDEAVEEYLAALRINPDYLEAHFNLGSVLSRQGRAAEADLHYAAALQIALRRGERFRAAGRLPEAVEAHRQATQIAPNNAAAFSSLGKDFLDLGRWEEAVAALRRAVELNPADAGAKQALETAEARRGTPPP